MFIKIELRGIKKKGNKLFLLKKYFKYLKNSKNKSVLNKIKSFILENWIIIITIIICFNQLILLF